MKNLTLFTGLIEKKIPPFCEFRPEKPVVVRTNSSKHPPEMVCVVIRA